MKIPCTKFSINNSQKLELEREEQNWLRYIKIIKYFPVEIQSQLLDFAQRSSSQIGQDIASYGISGCSNSGYFVEIGAADGHSNSNTKSLEEKGWTGLLVEPISHNVDIIRNSRTASIFKGVVSNRSGQTEFYEMQNTDLSTTIKPPFYRRSISRVVPSITGNKLFEQFDVPSEFDILSIDTEGSEYDVLKSIDFSYYRPKFVCVEHNYRPGIEVPEYLKSFGYRQILREQSLFDYWFIR